MEGMIREVFKKILDVQLPEIPRMSYQEAMERFGTDRPDTRFGLELTDVSMAVCDSGFRVFADQVASGGKVKAMRVPEGDRISNSRVKPKGDITEQAVKAGAAG